LLVQPSLRRTWELRRGNEVQATLELPVLRSGGRAEAEGRALRIEKHGQLRPEFVVRDEVTAEELVHLRREGRQSRVELGGEVAEWKRLGHRDGFGLVARDRQTLLRAKVRTSLLRSSGEVEVSDRLAERDGLWAALLASYLLIRKNEEDAAAASAASTAAVS
jgi:hypothetical protein